MCVAILPRNQQSWECSCLDLVDSKNSPLSSGLWELWDPAEQDSKGLRDARSAVRSPGSFHSPSRHAAASLSNLASASAGLMKPIEECILARL
jgi:hypothetical protein